MKEPGDQMDLLELYYGKQTFTDMLLTIVKKDVKEEIQKLGAAFLVQTVTSNPSVGERVPSDMKRLCFPSA